MEKEKSNFSQEETEKETDNKTNEVSILEQAKKLYEENKTLLEEMRKERIKSEKILTETLISGRSLIEQPKEKKEESPQEYKNRLERELSKR